MTRGVFWRVLCGWLVLCCPGFARGQYDPAPFLPESRLNLLIDEVSGALAMRHVTESGGYPRDRRQEEHGDAYPESRYIVDRARQYGFFDAHVETFPLEERAWRAERAELRIEKPVRRLIVRYRDVPAALAAGSWNAEVSAGLVYAGAGVDSSDYQGLDVKGKLVLVSGSMARAHRLAVRTFGAAGVLSFNNPSGRSIDHPDEVARQRIGGRPGEIDLTSYPYRATFGFSLSHRMGMALLSRLEAGQQVQLRAVVRTATYPGDMEVATAAIPGDGAGDREILLVAPLFEDIIGQGAKAISGSAALLEAGRALNALIDAGKLPRPRRTIRFLWTPGFAGAFAYLDRYPDERGRIIAALEVDRIGGRLTRSGAALHLYRNPDSMASFVDDVTQAFFEYAGATDREKGRGRRIFDPVGSRDPFYYHVEKAYDAPDHALLNGPAFRIPAVLFSNGPTSEDGPADLDPTQLKRGAFLLAASTLYMADVTARDVPRIAVRMASMSARRVDDDVMRQLEWIGAAGPDRIAERYRDARAFLAEAYRRERRSLESLRVFTPPASPEASRLAAVVSEWMKREGVDRNRLKNEFQRIVRTFDRPVPERKETDEEKIAGRLFPVFVPTPPDSSLPVVRRMRQALDSDAPPSTLGGGRARECRLFSDGRRSVLDIRNAVGAEFGPLPLADVMQYFHDLERRGRVFIRRK